jgi:hypothetical protein
MSPTSATAPAATSSLAIYEATRVAGGVRRGALLTLAQAEARRRAGLDIVVCGNDAFANCNEARRIETVVGSCYHDGPHAAGGLHALPHWQQRSGMPVGHSFYETNVTKALP